MTINEVLAIVCDHYEVDLSHLVSKKRDAEYCEPRYVAMYLLRYNLRLSLKRIGEVFGGRDHSTVISAINNVKNLACNDVAFEIELRNLYAKTNTEGLSREIMSKKDAIIEIKGLMDRFDISELELREKQKIYPDEEKSFKTEAYPAAKFIPWK